MHPLGRAACIVSAFVVTALLMTGFGIVYDAARRGELPTIHFARSE